MLRSALPVHRAQRRYIHGDAQLTAAYAAGAANPREYYGRSLRAQIDGWRRSYTTTSSVGAMIRACSWWPRTFTGTTDG
jgi:hypothetical protein